MKRLLVPLVFVLLIVVALQTEKAALLGKGDFGVRVLKDRPRAVELTWRDGIEAPMALRLEEAFRANRDQADLFVLNLSSPGGSLREGAKVIEVIERIAQTHRVETIVKRGRICLSMCVPIFLQGQRRAAAANSRWMFHQPVLMDMSGEIAEQPDFERNFTADKFFTRYFENSPMEETWREQLRRDWVGQEVWFTGQDLVDQNSNVVSELI
ncbi:MAG: ATP-dependent Clp protease proteolytic subunit [Pseudomonadota bacterium]